MAAAAVAGRAARPGPNIVLIVADDLGWGDLSCYGQKILRTPNIDRLAQEGARFTDFYAGSTVCAPSRCSLMTGLHMGHATVRGNRNPEVPLRPDDVTVAEVLKTAGYVTAQYGKWGVGGPVTLGRPNLQGFDDFLGYLSQWHAHTYYPEHRWDNEVARFIANNRSGRKGTYSHDVFMQRAMQFLDKLNELRIDNSTAVFFTSDNGPHSEGGHKMEFFDSNGPLRGMKRDLYEGGIRVPMLARWPGHIPAGRVSDQPWAFWDILPTFADLAGVPWPDNIDGRSFKNALLGRPQKPHEYLYWEFHERGFDQAVRMGRWKAVKRGLHGKIELYDLSSDIGEQNDLAARYPAVVRQIEQIMRTARTDSPDFPVSGRPPKGESR